MKIVSVILKADLLVFLILLQALNIGCFQNLLAPFDGRFGKSLTGAELLDNSGLFKLSLELLESTLNVLTFFHRYNDHTVRKINVGSLNFGLQRKQKDSVSQNLLIAQTVTGTQILIHPGPYRIGNDTRGVKNPGLSQRAIPVAVIANGLDHLESKVGVAEQILE